ncbi:SRPBCC family protein [Roseateles sp. BYS180W]|uniref:SRPBCC family protein n=1 Tax=Roseateles rivi TaxID=3299028 RepID=A0ABW7FTI1_9BURK
MPHTIELHRVLSAPPERVFRAFTEADALAQWLPPHGFTATVHALDLREGGRFRMSFRNFSTGDVVSFGGEYLHIAAPQLLRYTDVFDDPALPGTIEVEVRLSAVPSGTELQVRQSGIPEVIARDGCYLGWQQSLNALARLVEPDMRPPG